MWCLYFQIQYITLKSQRLKLAKNELREKKSLKKNHENLFLKISQRYIILELRFDLE